MAAFLILRSPPSRPMLQCSLLELHLNFQGHTTVKAESLFQQESCAEQLGVAMWPPHKLKSDW